MSALSTTRLAGFWRLSCLVSIRKAIIVEVPFRDLVASNERWPMQSIVTKFGLPLLARELTQLAARPRTFVLRTLYAVTLYAAALWFYAKWTDQFRPDSFEVLGQGKSLFEQLVNWQFWGLYLFLPVMTCGAIAVEKERMTLP
jgi:hypothetical protein